MREYALRADLRFITATQAWRFGGFAFLALDTYGVAAEPGRPDQATWPSGPPRRGCSWAWRVSRVRREPKICDWNVLGILDLIVAVPLGPSCRCCFPT